MKPKAKVGVLPKERAARRFDPDRRERILHATLDTIASHGVGETTLRRVAEQADVPLGSISYHFENREALLLEAFASFSRDMIFILEERFQSVGSKEDARTAVVEHICGDSWATPKNMLLCYELYACASRTAGHRDILQNWINTVRVHLEKHFDRRTADALDALIEGYTIHRSVDPKAFQRKDIEAIISRVSS